MRVEHRYVEILAEYVETKFTAECAGLGQYREGLLVSRSKPWEVLLCALGLDTSQFRRHVSKCKIHSGLWCVVITVILER